MGKTNVDVSGMTNEERFQKMVDEISPQSKIISNCIKAFFVGGIICIIGQFIFEMLMNMNSNEELSRMLTSIILIFLGVVFTGFGLYEKLGKFAGAGSIVPITGFANSVAAASIEFKKEGYILGVGAKMFIIAGPVILYGTATSIIVGIFYYFMK